ncbi:MAG TPA: hypothetical protein VKV02_02300, partial [Acidobacteriaceae bacterium]|nr:hypothetical protein [Acidobacteriaceae bacterium]
MVPWNNTRRRWKSAADESIALHRYGPERERLAAEIAKQIWVEQGGREWAEAREEGSLLMLETLVTPHLNDEVVRSALGLRHLAGLKESLRTADHEEGRSLAAECRWTEKYLEPEIQCSFLRQEEVNPASSLRTSAEQ